VAVKMFSGKGKPARAGKVSKASRLQALFSGIQFFKKQPGQDDESKGMFHDLNIKIVNRTLVVGLVVLMAGVFSYALKDRASVADVIEIVSRIQVQPMERKITEEFYDIASYLGLVSQRNIFKPFPKEIVVIDTIPDESEEARVYLQNQSQNFKVVGVSWGKPSRIMIRDESDKSTYILKEGQIIGSTGVMIQEILKDKAIISYKEQEMELL
jgi:hypothetical protein